MHAIKNKLLLVVIDLTLKKKEMCPFGYLKLFLWYILGKKNFSCVFLYIHVIWIVQYMLNSCGDFLLSNFNRQSHKHTFSGWWCFFCRAPLCAERTCLAFSATIQEESFVGFSIRRHPFPSQLYIEFLYLDGRCLYNLLYGINDFVCNFYLNCSYFVCFLFYFFVI